MARPPAGHAQHVHEFSRAVTLNHSLLRQRGHWIGAAWDSLARLLMMRGRGRAARLHPARQCTLSLLLLLLFAGLGWSAIPRDVTAAQSALLYRDPAAGTEGSIGAAVFVLRPDGVALRFGNATQLADGVIRVGFYDPLDPLLARASEPVSLPGDPRLLWLLASSQERAMLRDATSDLAVALAQSVVHIFQSPEFSNDYRDRYVALFRADVQNAWQKTRDSGAWQELLRGYEPILRDTASRDLRPVIERHFRAVPMRMLRANALELIDPFSSSGWNMQPIEDALQAAIQEIRNRELPERTAGRLLEAPPTTAFLRSFADALGQSLAQDTALRSLTMNMVLDERFRPYLNLTIARAMEVGRVVPRLFVSLHGSTDLNVVAAFVIRTMVTGRADRVVVFMSPAQRNELLALDASSVHRLDRVGLN